MCEEIFELDEIVNEYNQNLKSLENRVKELENKVNNINNRCKYIALDIEECSQKIFRSI